MTKMLIYNAERDDVAQQGAAVYRTHNLKWTTTPPTVEGWYWTKNDKGVYCVHFLDGMPPYNYFYSFSSEDGPTPPIKFTHYLGPIPQPEPPKDGE